MLPCRDHAVILQAMNESDTHPRGELRILAIGARIDDGIVRIVVDVEHRRVRDVDSERAPFECGKTSLLISERGVSRCANRHLRWEHDRSSQIDGVGNEVPATCAESGASLEIRPEQKGDLAHRLQCIQLRGHFDGRTHRDCEASDLFLLDVLRQSPPLRRLTQYIQQEKVGGFTISVGSPIEVAAKLNALQSMSKVPLLFGADLEAGAGFRARGGYFVPNAIDLGGAIVFPPEMAVGATRDTTLAYEQGRLTALEGRALGIHIAYAPVLDVNNNPDNPVINTRSYGEDPQLAARMGVAFIHGLQDHGMIATGKHFPGHGDTGVNSHLALPVVTVSRSRLDTVELVPFRAAVNGGVGAIMSFHGAMPALDSSGVPGTLSPKVLTGLLRGELGFRGIIISDAMDMRAVLDLSLIH